MPATDNDLLLLADYNRSATVRDRNTSGLIQWSGYTATLPIPAPPLDDAWVRARIVAERIPAGPDGYCTQTMAYFQQDGATLDNIRAMLSAYNSPADENDLIAITGNIIGAFMPRFSSATVTQADIEAWKVANAPAVVAAQPARAGEARAAAEHPMPSAGIPRRK